MKRFSRLAWTVRYLAPGQVWHRARRRGREAWWKLIGARAGESAPDARLVRVRQHAGLADCGPGGLLEPGHRQAALELLGRLERDEFRFLNRTLEFRDGIRWDTPEASHLWRYHLHYFEYLEGLVVLHAGGGPEAERAWVQFRRLVLCWIDGNARLRGDGWHPYTISLRLVNWLNAAESFFERIEGDPGFERRFVGSVMAQASVLSDHLELDVRGNHLLENLRALIWVGSGIDSPRAKGWLDGAVAHLDVELAEQVRADGGHFERCPGYHVLVLQRLIEIGHRLQVSTGSIPGFVGEPVRRMLEFLQSMRTPDGGVPLLKDTAADAHPVVDEVLTEGALVLRDRQFAVRGSVGLRALLLFGRAGAAWLEGGGREEVPAGGATRFLAGSGYVCSRTAAGDFFVWDAGPPCPDYLPAHAHADAFTFDLWIRGRPWVVDSGVYEYSAGTWRNFFRATRAHSTVEVDGANQSDVYSSFRVGRRARVRGVECREVRDGAFLAQGWHDGYRHLGAIHRRVILFRPGSYWVVADVVTGHGEHEIRTRLQLHPSVEAREGERGSWTLEREGQRVFVTTAGYGTVRALGGEEAGWHSERFGERTRRVVFECAARTKLPFVGIHALASDAPVRLGEPRAVGGGSVSVSVEAFADRFELHLPSDASVGASVS